MSKPVKVMHPPTGMLARGVKKMPAHLVDDYWSSMTSENQKLYVAVRPLPTAAYTVDTRLAGLEDMLDGWAIDAVGASGSFELEPDFQRGHVWTQAQQVSYMEALIRKTAPVRILFNCPGWTHGTTNDGDIPDNTMQCIDGLQRLTAVRKFLAGEFKVFGGYSVADMKGSPFDPGRLHLQMAVYEFNRRSDLLQFYLDLNAGGTVHAPSELDRVGELLRAAKAVP